MSLKRNVTQYAKKKNVPVYLLEEETGIARGSISRWDDINPGIDKVKAVADKLGVTVDELLAENGTE
ncbi:MAG: helix-turn-helix domain-containing protein [Lachnospiraceae bacterium]|nr:helix-turn-helix domain-containing protein [Lachnospiraceae bacterium]